MDEIRQFFSNSSSVNSQVVKLRGPLTGGLRLTKNDSLNEFNRKEEHRRSQTSHMGGTDYVRDIKERENKIYVEKLQRKSKFNTNESISEHLDSLEQLSLMQDESEPNMATLSDEAMLEVYSKYHYSSGEKNHCLPIYQFKDRILKNIKSNSVVIIEGPTGCGKTTQVPQWILHDCYQNRVPCKIIVTQPRRIAATSIAKRVAEENGWDLGGVVGYQVALHNKTSRDTRISYVTTGLLLEKLVASKTMNEYTHIILDEVHERGQEMDFLLLVVKKLLYTVSPNVRVVLMSATFNIDTFASYFTTPTTMGTRMPACITVVEEKPIHDLKLYYLDHLTKFSLVQSNTIISNEPGITKDMYLLVLKLITAFEDIDKKEEASKVDYSKDSLPSILVFLPGINEIEEMYVYLMDLELRKKMAATPEVAKYKWWVLPLHSTITADEQARVFVDAPPGHRKIILSTNIAESSITVPGIKYVIDFCLSKILVADECTNFTTLQLAWASKTNCEQRAGRSGRVRDGRVYRLVTSRFYENLPDECPPEIVRCPLERLVLLAKTLDMGAPHEILALAMDPPDLSNIHRTILVLKEVGALKREPDEDWCLSDGEITYLGRIMAKLPLDIRISKLIMLGYIFGCFEECIIMAAAMSVRNIFNSPFRERLNAYNSKLTWADGSTSDCIALLNVYKVWNRLRKGGHFKIDSEALWARRFYVQVRGLRELDDMLRELRLRLSKQGLDVSDVKSPWNRNEISFVLKVLIAGAFYPQYFVQAQTDETRERDAVRTLSGHDPRNTVYLSNFPSGQPRDIYASAIKNIVSKQIGHEPRVIFDKNCSKVYLTFNENYNPAYAVKGTSKKQNDHSPEIPGQVLLPIYKAIKARQLKMDIRIPLLSPEKAASLAAALQVDRMNMNVDMMVPRLPEVDDTHIPLRISQHVHVSKFWIQHNDETTWNDLRLIEKQLNTTSLLAYTEKPTPDTLLAAPYAEDNKSVAMYRARVLRLSGDSVEVSYIDYGSLGKVNVSNLRELPDGICTNIPPLAMLCTLAELAPAPLFDDHGQWSNHAVELFNKIVARGPLVGKVYSVCRGTVAIELFAEGGNVSVNKALLDKGFAVPCEESYESKLNHDLRQTANELNMMQKRAYNREQMETALCNLHEVKPPTAKDCVADVHLKGPYSPLEMVAHSMMYASRDKQVAIEWHSVNSVLLDTNPQEVTEKLLVATSVSQNETSSKLTLYNTTRLPNLPGMPALMALLFCPIAEFRRSEDRVHYVSVLCGLGSTPRGAPHFPEHDLLVNVDADLTVADIGVINHIRHLIDSMMYCEEGFEKPFYDNNVSAKIAYAIRQDLMTLLRKHRKQHTPTAVPDAWNWRSAPEDDLLEVTEPDMVRRSVVYPLHAPLELYPRSRDDLLSMHKLNDNLKRLVTRSVISSDAEFKCELCGTNPMAAHAMRIHLYSNAHKEKEEDFRVFNA